MPATKLIMICTFERLLPYDTASHWAFGMNLSVAVDDIPAPVPKALLEPWNWTPPRAIVAFVRPIGGGPHVVRTGTIDDFRFKGRDRAEWKPLRDRVVAALDHERTLAETDSPAGENFALATASRANVAVSSWRAGPKRPWHAAVKQASKYPAPIPQLLNLSANCWLAKDATLKPEAFVIAPVLEQTSGVFPDPCRPLPVEPGPPMGNVYALDYDKPAAGGLAVVARTVAIPVGSPVPSTTTYFDFGSLWVKKGANTPDSDDEDWRTSLETRLADSLDAGRIVLDAASTLGNEARTPDAQRVVQQMILAALRDHVGVGHRASSKDAPCLLDSIYMRLRREGTFVDDVLRNRIESASRKLFGTVNLWAKFVRSVVKEFDGLRVLAKDLSATDARHDPGEFEETVRALTSIRQAVWQPTVLEALFRAQIAAIASELKDVAPLQEIASKDPLPVVDLRRQLALDHLWPIWKDILDDQQSQDVRDYFRTQLARIMKGYVNQRFGLALTGALPLPAFGSRYPELDAGLNKTPLVQPIGLAIDAWAAAAARRLVGDRDAAATVPRTTTAHAITVQVAGVERLPAEGAADPLDWSNGVALLMRRTPAAGTNAPWHCLNFAALAPRVPGVDPNTFQIGDPEPDLVALVAKRLVYANDVRQALESYDNHPLSAESPAAKISVTSSRTPNDDPLRPSGAATTQHDRLPGVLSYLSPDGSTIAGLRFGSDYQIAPLVVTNSGAVPKSLCGERPFELDTAKLAGQVLPNALLGQVARSVKYRRRTPVGEVRLFNSGTANEKYDVPVIAEGVAPRARDLGSGTLAIGEDVDKLPLILLGPRTKPGCELLWVECPSTDLVTWDRWAGHALPLEQRERIWADYYRIADSNSRGGVQASLSIDDPAVVPTLYATLQRVDDTGKLETGTTQRLEYPARAFDPARPLESLRKGRVRIALARSSESIPPDGAPTAVFRVEEGCVYVLTLQSVVTTQDATEKFEIYANVPNLPGQSSVRAVSALRMFVEVSTPKLLDVDDDDGQRGLKLFEAMSATPSTDQDPPVLDIRLKPLSGAGAYKFIQRMELGRQTWYWQGRETARHVAFSSEGLSAEDWEQWEYGNRDDDDHLMSTMSSTVTGPAGQRSFSAVEPLAAPGARREAALRAQHHRFFVRAIGRYEPLYRDAATRPVAVSEHPAKGRWLPVLVPGRRTTPVLPPKLRLVLPLTESFDPQSTGTPGVLAVFDEPWHEAGGIAEFLEAEVEIVSDAAGKPFWQTGPDPILDTVDRGLSKTAIAPAKEDKVLIDPKQIRGPIGHTFDRVDAARFLATSFIIPPPTITRGDGAKGFDPRWSFAKIRFRRAVISGALPDARVLDCDWTESVWVQYMPEFSLIATSTSAGDIRSGELAAHVPDPTTTEIRLVHRSDFKASNSNAAAVDVTPKTRTLVRYLVVTHLIADVTGRPDQEVYYGVYRYDATQRRWVLLTPEGTPQNLDPKRVRARLVDVQISPKSTKPVTREADLWSSIFDDPTNPKSEIDRSRIVSVSEPIDTTALIDRSTAP